MVALYSRIRTNLLPSLKLQLEANLLQIYLQQNPPYLYRINYDKNFEHQKKSNRVEKTSQK